MLWLMWNRLVISEAGSNWSSTDSRARVIVLSGGWANLHWAPRQSS
jgi:hypothetical protein